MKKIRNSWPSSKSGKNVLLFAQTMQELLIEENWDNYRVYALDTITRLKDLAYVARSGKHLEKYLNDVKDEAVWSMRDDHIAKEVLGKKYGISLASLSSSGLDAIEFLYRADFINETLEKQYHATSKALLIDKIFGNGKKAEIRQLAACYCSFLVRKGYSKPYVSSRVKEYFFSCDHVRFSRKKLEQFFNIFDLKRRQYKFFIKVNRSGANFLSKAMNFKLIEEKNLPKTYVHQDPKYFQLSKKKKIISLIYPEALDPYSARDDVHTTFTSIQSMTLLEPSGEQNLEWDSTMFAVPENKRSGQTIRSSGSAIKQKKHFAFKKEKSLFNKFIYQVFSSKYFKGDSLLRLHRSINTYSLAVNSDVVDTQLVSLWAALETLLIDEVYKSKFSNCSNALNAAINIRYAEKCFESFYCDLERIYKKDFSTIVNKETNISGKLQKFISIVILDKNSHLRSELARLLINNPLGLYRLSELKRKFSSIESMSNTYVAHSKRVNWQISRIYRVRNEIVHAGNSPDYTDSLAINLESYYRIFLQTIMVRADAYEKSVPIEQLISDIKVLYEEHKRILNKNEKVSGYALVKFIMCNNLTAL